MYSLLLKSTNLTLVALSQRKTHLGTVTDVLQLKTHRAVLAGVYEILNTSQCSVVFYLARTVHEFESRLVII